MGAAASAAAGAATAGGSAASDACVLETNGASAAGSAAASTSCSAEADETATKAAMAANTTPTERIAFNSPPHPNAFEASTIHGEKCGKLNGRTDLAGRAMPPWQLGRQLPTKAPPPATPNIAKPLRRTFSQPPCRPRQHPPPLAQPSSGGSGWLGRLPRGESAANTLSFRVRGYALPGEPRDFRSIIPSPGFALGASSDLSPWER